MYSLAKLHAPLIRGVTLPYRPHNPGMKRAVLAAVVSASLFTAACGSVGEKDSGDGLAPGDYTIATAEGVSDSVVVNGKIAPARAINITTPLQTEVERIAVAPGDRVKAEQFLASLNVDQLQKQLDAQQRQQANAQADAMQTVETAQAQLNMLNEQINNGTHPAIAAAQSQVSQAQAAYNAAAGANGTAGVVLGAVRVATQMAGHISSQVDQAVSSHLPGGTLPGIPQVPQVPAQAPQVQVPAPQVQLPQAPAQAPAQGLTAEQLAQLTGAGAGAGAGMGAGAGVSTDQAYAALQEAKANLAAARSQAEQERLQAQAQVDSAWRAAENAKLGDGDGTLEYQVQEATIYSPIAGIVTRVDVQEGDIPQGRILSVADDSRLLIRADVREADVPNIAKDNRVKFTSTATGKKEFTGRVVRVSPAGDSEPDGAAAAAMAQGGRGGDSTVTFPVEIEVTGDKEGLLLGGSVRAEIVTAESKDALNVPVDAVFEDGGKQKVLVLATDKDGDRSGKVEERVVETGAANDVDIAVTGGEIKAGDIVINWPEDYRGKVGQKVEITDSGFDPAEVEEAKKTRERTTATVTVTSTRKPAGTPAEQPAAEPAPAAN